jgi:hypothetical protein
VPGIEVLNFGVSGYGIDQAYLRYLRDGRRHRPHVVILGFMTDDFARAVSSYRLFQLHDSRIPFAKPRFVVENGALRLLPNPLPSRTDYDRLLDDETAGFALLGANDFEYSRRPHASPFDVFATVRVTRLAWDRWVVSPRRRASLTRTAGFNPRAEAFAVNVAVFEAFAAAVRSDGAVPLVVSFPGRTDRRYYDRAREAPYAVLRTALEARGIPALDTWDALGSPSLSSSPQGRDALYRAGHCSPAGNRVVAAFLAPRLAALAHGPDRDAVDQAGRYEAHEAAQAPAQR